MQLSPLESAPAWTGAGSWGLFRPQYLLTIEDEVAKAATPSDIELNFDGTLTTQLIPFHNEKPWQRVVPLYSKEILFGVSHCSERRVASSPKVSPEKPKIGTSPLHVSALRVCTYLPK